MARVKAWAKARIAGEAAIARAYQRSTTRQTSKESLPEIDYNHYDEMTPAALLKEAKAAKLSPNLLRHELMEQLLQKANPDCIYVRGVLDLANDGWGFLLAG